MWFFYCEKKNKTLSSSKGRMGVNFDEIVDELLEGNTLIIKNPSGKHPNQECFLIELRGYPFLVPFNKRGSFYQLITCFPSRRFK